jgi:gas vesicle protein
LLEFISFIIFIVLFFIVLSYAYVQKRKNMKLIARSMQLELDKLALSEKLSEAFAIKDGKNLEQTEGFVRFLSQSRDWAFSYIEEVQKNLDAVIQVLEPKVNSLKKASTKQEYKELADLVSETLAQLKTVLPEEKED